MCSGFRAFICVGVSSFALLSSGFAFAITMGSLAPHDTPANAQANGQWVTDPRTQCIAADPGYIPDDSISWQGKCRRDGVIYGAGTLTFLNKGQVVETVTGTFGDGLLQPGPVTAIWSDGTKYQGNQLGGLFNGPGKFIPAKGEAIDGEWKMGAFRTGKSSITWPNGDRYDGELKDGKPDGQGVEVWADGRRYEGQWHDGLPVGDVQANATGTTTAGATGVALSNAAATAQPPVQNAAMPQSASANPANSVAPPAPTLAAATIPARMPAGNGDNAAPNPALPLRAELGTPLSAVDGAILELGLTGDGFERTLVLPNGNSQEVRFAFANGPVGTVSDGQRAIGVFRARSDQVDIDYADGTTETMGEGPGGGLIERAQSVDGHAMCTAWYPQSHVFSQEEKQAAVQEYASRLGLAVSAPAKTASRKQHPHDASPACGGAFIASGSQQKAADTGTETNSLPKAAAAPAERAQPGVRAATLENSAVIVPASAIHPIDQQPAQLEKASFAPDQPTQSSTIVGAATAAPQPGASNCLTVTNNGDYWGFQNNCAKSVQCAYCEMSDANPLTSCKRTSVAGSVAAKSFSALVSDRSLAEKNAEHEFRWLACDGGAGEVVPHLDKVDPPTGRCERQVATAE